MYLHIGKDTLIDTNGIIAILNIETLENKEWEDFFLIDIFTTIQRGKRLTKQNQTKGY